MPRLTKLEDLLFPVEVHPVFVSVTGNGGDKRLAVPDKKAIVNKSSHRVLGIISRGYRLVSNREALEMAYECCRTAFPETKPVEWEAKAVDAPSTAGHCHIDLEHNSKALDFAFVAPDQRPDAFGPFIRVTNSYNGLRALQFDIGFYRKICKNGLIVPDTIIRFKFVHQRRDIGETIKFEIDQGKLAKFKTAFTESLTGLHDCSVPRSQFKSLICGVLLIRPPEANKRHARDTEYWEMLSQQLDEMIARYVKELGENAYAAFNVITELASHPPENCCIHRDRHSLQRLAGSWLTSFSAACRRPDFKFREYLEQLEPPECGSELQT